ncbi:MAG: hypothetical protein IKE17_14640 [Clostridia bacterium]|nr:hypothetical protein [Clostridia bacterium]
MDDMTAKEFLVRARRIDRRIEETRERLERMRGQLGGRVANLSGIPGSRQRWSDKVDDMIDIELRLEKQIREMCQIKREVMDAIDGVDDPLGREVLELYYLDGLSWGDVASRMHYSVRNVQILHGKALPFVRVPCA